MMRKAISIFLVLTFLVGLVPIGTAAAEEATTTPQAEGSGTIVILASGNPADRLAAYDLKLMIGGDVKIVITDWGTFDDEIMTQIEELSPSMVIIIGGQAAVPLEYDDALSNDGIDVVRIGGENQYETLRAVIEWALENGYSYSGDAAVIEGKAYGKIFAMIDEGMLVIFDKDDINISSEILPKLDVKVLYIDEDLENIHAVLDGQYSVQVITKQDFMNKTLQKLNKMAENAPPEVKEKIKKKVIAIINSRRREHVALQVAADEDVGKVIEKAAHAKEIHKRNRYLHQLVHMMRYMKRLHKGKEYSNTITQIRELIREGKYDEARQLIQQFAQQLGLSEEDWATHAKGVPYSGLWTPGKPWTSIISRKQWTWIIVSGGTTWTRTGPSSPITQISVERTNGTTVIPGHSGSRTGSSGPVEVTITATQVPGYPGGVTSISTYTTTETTETGETP